MSRTVSPRGVDIVAHHLAGTHSIEPVHIEPHQATLHVRSQTVPERWYQTTIDPEGEHDCTCGHINHTTNTTCKHGDAAELWLRYVGHWPRPEPA